MTSRRLMHDDDILLTFDASQEARHAAVLRLNEMARALVERTKANAAGAVADENGEIPGPARLRMVLGIDRDEKSAKQRRFLHGVVFSQIAEQVVMPDGTRYVAAIWKEHFRKLFLPDQWESRRMPGAKRATPHRVRISTEDLSLLQYSRLIDSVIDHAVKEWGVTFDFVAEDREAVRHQRKKLTPKEVAYAEADA